MQITTIGLDLAKNVFQVHGIDANETVVVRKRLRRSQALAFFKALPPCLIGMEACATAHYWARELTKLGHRVRLMPAKDVKAYVKRNKNDAADAEAICEGRNPAVQHLNSSLANPLSRRGLPWPGQRMHFDGFNKREVITLLGGAAAAWPLAARAQPTEQVRRIGVLMGFATTSPEGQAFRQAFGERLRERGWTDGARATVDYRWAAGDRERFKAYASELVALKPEVILAHTTPAVAALRQETTSIPIVFVSVTDPVGQGLVTNLARPGGNILQPSPHWQGIAGCNSNLAQTRSSSEQARVHCVAWRIGSIRISARYIDCAGA